MDILRMELMESAGQIGRKEQQGNFMIIRQPGLAPGAKIAYSKLIRLKFGI